MEINLNQPNIYRYLCEGCGAILYTIAGAKTHAYNVHPEQGVSFRAQVKKLHWPSGEITYHDPEP